MTTSQTLDAPTNALGADCGPHCGTEHGRTAHCPCCHAWSLTEADGCAEGWDGSRWVDISEDHQPGSHELTDLADDLAARTSALVLGRRR